MTETLNRQRKKLKNAILAKKNKARIEEEEEKNLRVSEIIVLLSKLSGKFVRDSLRILENDNSFFCQR